MRARYAFSTNDLSIYERIDPAEFPDFDRVDSTTIGSQARVEISGESPAITMYDVGGRVTYRDGPVDGDIS